MPQPNDPYSRPIHATKPHHQPVLGLHGEPANKHVKLAIASNPNARPIHVPAPGTMPAWPEEAPEAAKSTRKKKAASPSTDVTSPSDDNIPPPPEPLAQSVTEDDLFG